jgi:hypothetical protein
VQKVERRRSSIGETLFSERISKKKSNKEKIGIKARLPATNQMSRAPTLDSAAVESLLDSIAICHRLDLITKTLFHDERQKEPKQ